ncbi:MAG: ATP-grasp domain-containing protein [Aequorivita sp.]|nr:ATP-grasp domain-containing protein [Aequorivita sp.]MCB0467308.1 ATP-grasp domain-containing protein [Aequorivita sp.]
MIKVGILDGQTVQALIVAKQLSKAGFRVILFCDSRLSYGYYTKYAHERLICPSPEKQIEEFNSFFLKYIESNGLDVVVPMTDYSAKYLSKNKAALLDKVAFSIPDYEIFMNGYDKNQLMNVCLNNNIPHPMTIDLSSLEKGSEVMGFKFPALIKPNQAAGARGFKKVKSFKELWKSYEAIYKEFGDCHAQEFIPKGGRQFEAQILIKENEVLMSTINEQIRYYPKEGGSSCFNQTVENDHIIEICTKALRLIKWEGFADFDLIEDPRDGSIKIMEINPRVPACIKSSVIAGVDFPKAIVELSLNQPITTYVYKPGNYLRYFSLDLLWLFSSQNKLKLLKSWLNNFFSRKHFFQDGEIMDPVPFIVGAFSGIAKQLDPKFRSKKQGLNKALLFVIEMDMLLLLV